MNYNPSSRLDSAKLHYLVDLRFKVKGGLYFLQKQKVAKTFKKNFLFDFFTLDSANQAQNAESALDSAKNRLDSAIPKQVANSSIFDEKSGLCGCEREDRTNGSSTKRATNLPDLSQKDAEFVSE